MKWHKYWQESPSKTNNYYIKILKRDLSKVGGEVHIPDKDLTDDILFYITEEDSQSEDYKVMDIDVGVHGAGFYLQAAGHFYKAFDKDIVYWSDIPEIEITQEDAKEIYEKFYEN